jgi:hypothetical protein
MRPSHTRHPARRPALAAGALASALALTAAACGSSGTPAAPAPPAGFEPALTAPEAGVAIYRICLPDPAGLGDRRLHRGRSFRISSGS